MARSDFDALTQWLGSLSGPGILVLGQPLIAEATPWSRSVDHVLPDYRQYGRLIRALFDAQHDVVLLTGDVHFSRIASCRLHAEARLIEVISSPLALVDPGAGSLPVTSPSEFPVAPLPQGITPVGVDYHRVGRPRDVSLAPASGRCAENCMTIAFGLAAANASTVRMRVRAWLLDRPHDEDTGLPIRDYEWETELR
jgi:hypothetical protein